MRALLLIGSLLAWASLAACATPPTSDQPSVIVVGKGTASQEADYATIEYVVRGEGKTAPEALKALAALRTKIEDGVTALAGADAVRIESGRFNVQEARGTACGEDGRYDSGTHLSAGECAVKGAIATLRSTATIVPASKAGDAVSLAGQLGGSEVEIGESGIKDHGRLMAAAAKSAIDDAHRQAMMIAEASGWRLGPIIRVEDNNANRGGSGLEEIVVTARRRTERMSPEVPITLRPPPITETSTLDVTYQVER